MLSKQLLTRPWHSFNSEQIKSTWKGFDMKINTPKPPFSSEWQMRTHRLPICVHVTAPTPAKSGFLGGMAWPLDANKKVCIHASPTLEGVAGIRQHGVSAGELWVLQSSHAPRVTRLSTRIESTWSTSACAWVLWTGAFLDSPLQHRQFCHLRVAYWGPRPFPVPSDKKAAQSRSWQHLQAAHRCLLLPRIHPPPPPPLDRRRGLWGGLFLFCSPGMSNTSSRIHPLSQGKKNPQQICKKRHLKKIFNHL